MRSQGHRPVAAKLGRGPALLQSSERLKVGGALNAYTHMRCCCCRCFSLSSPLLFDRRVPSQRCNNICALIASPPQSSTKTPPLRTHLQRL